MTWRTRQRQRAGSACTANDRSITAARSRHAQYSLIAPWLSKLAGSQYPRYSVIRRVSADHRGWNAVCWVSSGSLAGVTRRAIARVNRFSAG